MGFLQSLLGGGMGAMVPGLSGGMGAALPGAMSEGVMGFPSVGMKSPAPPVPAKKPFRDTGFANVLGTIGDILLTANGHAPVYGPGRAYRQQQDRQQQSADAMANYLGKLGADPALLDLVRTDPSTGLQMYQAGQRKDPEEIALMRIAGIDPQSEEGRAIITRKLAGGGGSDPTFVRELEALGIDPHSDDARELYYGRNSPAGYLLTPKSRGSAPQGSNVPRVSDQASYDAVPPGQEYITPDGTIRRKPGGPTETPSGGFSVTARNNNPGALRVPGSKRFQKFASVQDGIAAQEALLGRYHKRGLTSVSRVVETYAPRMSRGGDNTDEQVNNYIAYVAKRIGVDPTAAIPAQMLPRLAQAMREFETGKRVQ